MYYYIFIFKNSYSGADLQNQYDDLVDIEFSSNEANYKDELDVAKRRGQHANRLLNHLLN